MPRATLFAAIVVAIDALALPSNDRVPVTSPVSSMVRAVVRAAAVPVVLALIVAGRLRVTAPAEAETVTSSAVPSRLVTPPPPPLTTVVAMEALALPSKDTLPVTSPVKAMVRAVVRAAAVPVVLALIVAGRLMVTAPADAETVTSSAVPNRLVTPGSTETKLKEFVESLYETVIFV